MRRRGFLRALLAAAALPALPKPEPESHVFEWQDGPPVLTYEPVLLDGLEPNAAYECGMRIGGARGWTWDVWTDHQAHLAAHQRLRNRELAARLELLP